MKANPFIATLVAALTLLGAPPAGANGDSIILQSTTSTANSGLYDYLLPRLRRDTGVTVNVVAVGTGQAIKNAQNCDADVLLVHAKLAEEKFVAAGHGVERFDLMYNDFVFVGPPADPASISGGSSAVDALRKIAAARARFASRGDNSGTHKKEMALWQRAGIDPAEGSGKWYLETGSGMGATLNAAVGSGAYTMTDRATWISFANKQDFTIQLEGDRDLFNQYGIILVDPKKCARANSAAGQKFIDWMLSDRGQKAIAAYRLDGRQLFFPNAARQKK